MTEVDLETEGESGAALDVLLRATLAPPSREPDTAFADQVSAAVVEAERYRRWRSNFRRRLATDLLTLGGIAGALAVLAQAPAIGGVLTQTPALAVPIMLLFLAWLGFNRGRYILR